MTHYLLIHGSWHGAWCWFKVAPQLKSLGHSVDVPDLLGRGNCKRATQLISLKAMVREIGRTLCKDRKTTIVVHSRYGILASALSEMFPDQIERVVYLASYMIPNQARAARYFRADKASLLTPYVTISKAGFWDELHPDIYREGLYHDCSEEDVTLASSLLCREPLRPALSKLVLSEDRYGSVPRAYIRLTEDRAVTRQVQDRCIGEVGVDRVESIHASHSAYFSRPTELVEKILSVCRP
ncbi:alpha/beta fold hydrolase [Cognatishimia maritima]|uniref:Pimeloyl-ACP methyl ester carboxylesterase n=1 Tax=Cognatishimia maritima TaxID=870908 RepID=A0A1M5NWJ4_9RHOB|nr:alpha/beta fold hydrolase [Cognatishimia maritima]SHG93529.1 Pimeloyl-ACP methyl ester carboxylesterase [Cognatishimia maritima]